MDTGENRPPPDMPDMVLARLDRGPPFSGRPVSVVPHTRKL
ncbi:hypothetical protein LMG24238_05831 [Paraburkholderia sediminicola]|uniref:Uncharacterized protein n=1 Tax=Paraburkholderia sediminicola TaxID=458836 RepID=A0A6J5CAX3_9BURK|nr:hypothetical protein LMG24238_05831 [Paraburkholderia sediminicola]